MRRREKASEGVRRLLGDGFARGAGVACLADECVAADGRQKVAVDDRDDVAKSARVLALVAVEARDKVLARVASDL